MEPVGVVNDGDLKIGENNVLQKLQPMQLVQNSFESFTKIDTSCTISNGQVKVLHWLENLEHPILPETTTKRSTDEENQEISGWY